MHWMTSAADLGLVLADLADADARLQTALTVVEDAQIAVADVLAATAWASPAMVVFQDAQDRWASDLAQVAGTLRGLRQGVADARTGAGSAVWR